MNSEELREEWKRVYEQVLGYDSVDASQTSAFFSRLQPQAMSDGFLMLTADNDFIKKWIESHYYDHIRNALRDLHGTDFVVAIEVDENQGVAEPLSGRDSSRDATREQWAGEGGNSPQGQVVETAGASFQAIQGQGSPQGGGSQVADGGPQFREDLRPSAASPISWNNQAQPAPSADNASQPHPAGAAGGSPSAGGHQSAAYDSNLSPTSSLTFENFVIGESNRMAYSMAVTVAEEPGKPMLNPLFIYGKSGLGKTHLMRAIQNYVAETRPDMKTVYVDSADFLSGYVEAALDHDRERSSFKDFKNYYQDADMLLIDDIQQLQGKEQTLDIVFQIFNTMVDQGKQVVLSADRAPKSITVDERFQSRFNMGGTFDIQPPEVETKLGIIMSFIEEYRTTSKQPYFEIPDEISRYIAENSSSNIRELKSAVTKVIYAINAFGKDEITTERVTQLLENHFSGGAMKKLTIGDIQKQVELYYGVSHNEITGQKRERKIVYARQIAIYLCREMLDLPFNNIAKSFGGRDHTTVMYSVSQVEKKMASNRETREEIENIKRRIKDM